MVTLRSLLLPSSGSRQSRKSQLYQGWPVGPASGAALFEAIQARQITIYFSSTLSLSIPVPRTTRGYFQLVRRKAVHCLHYLDVILMFKLARAADVHPYLVSWEEVFCSLPSVSSLPLTDSSFCYTAVSAAAPLLIATHSTQQSRAQTLQTAHCTVDVSSFRHYETLKWICVGLPSCKGQQLRYKY